MLLKRHLEVDPPPSGHLKILENWHGGRLGFGAAYSTLFTKYSYGTKSKMLYKKYPRRRRKLYGIFTAQMQFSLNKLHFPDEKSANFSPAPSAPAKFVAKLFVCRAPSARGPNFWGPSVLKSGSAPPPTLAEKKLGDDTKKPLRTAFSQWCL